MRPCMPTRQEELLQAELAKLRSINTELLAFAEGVAENAERFADNYTYAESLRTELRGFAEAARQAIAKAEGRE